jgi:hypothetical protein
MELEIRNKKGSLLAKYKGDAATCQLIALHSSTQTFNVTTKKFVNDPKTYNVFVCIDNCKFMITDDIELHFEPGDYVKVC